MALPRGWVPLDSHEIVHVHWTASMQMKRQLTIFYGMANVGWTYPSYIHLCSELWIVTTLTNPAVFHIISSQNSHPPPKKRPSSQPKHQVAPEEVRKCGNQRATKSSKKAPYSKPPPESLERRLSSSRFRWRFVAAALGSPNSKAILSGHGSITNEDPYEFAPGKIPTCFESHVIVYTSYP